MLLGISVVAHPAAKFMVRLLQGLRETEKSMFGAKTKAGDLATIANQTTLILHPHGKWEPCMNLLALETSPL